jgi:2-keto-4-pentenoate hydratase
MKENQNTNSVAQTLRATSQQPVATCTDGACSVSYTAPDIEVTDIELENTFATSIPDTGDGGGL